MSDVELHALVGVARYHAQPGKWGTLAGRLTAALITIGGTMEVCKYDLDVMPVRFYVHQGKLRLYLKARYDAACKVHSQLIRYHVALGGKDGPSGTMP